MHAPREPVGACGWEIRSHAYAAQHMLAPLTCAWQLLLYSRAHRHSTLIKIPAGPGAQIVAETEAGWFELSVTAPEVDAHMLNNAGHPALVTPIDGAMCESMALEELFKFTKVESSRSPPEPILPEQGHAYCLVEARWGEARRVRARWSCEYFSNVLMSWFSG